MIPSLVRIPGYRCRVALGLALIGLAFVLAASAHASPAFGPKEYVQGPTLPLPVIESFPACQPEQGGQLRVENGPGGRPRAALAVVVLNRRETVLMVEGPGQPRVRERPVQLTSDNAMLVWMIGPPGATLAVGVTSAGACLEVAITSPAPGARVPEGPLLVRGTVNAPGQAGVSVNGFPAMVHGGQWAVEIPVDPSVQLLTATASMIGGESTTTSVPITTASASPVSIELRADPAEGITPLVVTWKVVNTTGRVIVQYELDRTGSGAFDPPTPNPDGTQATYSTSGLWFPTLRATDEQGVIYTTTTIVLAGDPAAVSARFDVLWAGFKLRLQARDVPGALLFLSPALRPRMELVFQQLGADLPAVVASFGDLHLTDQVGEMAEAVLVQDEPTGRALYFIQFRRDSLGRWLIEEM